ncbi:MAG: histidine phosphatase family protein, partial [Vulcanimicrobiaceae bacterium]
IEIVFVRHGATDWNRDRRFQGQSDIPLNDEGRAQAEALARTLSAETFDRAIASDLTRAYDTARIIARASGIAIERDPRWREFDFGNWEGLTWEEILERQPQLRDDQQTQPAYYTPDAGETFDRVCARVAEALDALRSAAPARVLVATHAGPLHAALSVLFNLRDDANQPRTLGVRLLPASITRVTMDEDGAQLITLNDVAHLNSTG